MKPSLNLLKLLPAMAMLPAMALAERPVAQAPSTDTLLMMMGNTQQEMVAAPAEEHGHKMFNASCTQCHDADRSTSAHKPYDAWLTTVRRMGDKSGANIPESQIEPIAKYLASLNPDTTTDDADIPLETAQKPVVTLTGSASLIYRDSDAILENNGFFADVWVGAEWQPEGSPMSVKVMACTSCHENAGLGMSFELMEGSLTADLLHLVTGQSRTERNSDLKATAKAGRFVVPFGAFANSVHPGTYRTLTYPLMYNMGRRVGPEEFQAPVLPMPYSDEGINFHVGIPLPAQFWANLDAYAVNGLQPDFYSSRSYRDNNTDTAIGGRATLGNSWVQVGGSYSSGEMQYNGSAVQDYRLIGGDATLRYQDIFRAYYEYARREEDTLPGQESQVEGHIGEVEGTIWKKPRITLVVRYDTLDHSGLLGESSTERISWGPTLSLGESLLILNHEHWMFDAPFEDEDVIGFRWVAWF